MINYKTKIVVLVSAVAVIGLIYGFHRSLLPPLGTWLAVESPLHKSDLIVALGGSRDRQDKALALLERGFAQWVLFAGPDFRSRDYHCLAIARQGIEPPFAAYTTYEEALLVRKVLEERRLRSVIVVTSPYHLRRTRMIFDHVLAETKVDLMFSAAGNNAFSLDRWWKNHFGRKLILMEYLGLAYYWLQLKIF